MFGYVDLLQRAREHAPDTVSPTCDDSTWNDTILVSPQLVPLVRQTGVLAAHAFDRHKPFKVEFEFPNNAILTKRLQLPSGWNVPSHAEPLLESAHSACATERWETVQSLPAGDRLGAWAQMVEHSVSWACNQQISLRDLWTSMDTYLNGFTGILELRFLPVLETVNTRSQHMFKETVTHNLSQHGGSLVYHLLRPPSRPPITHLDLHESVPYQMQRAHHKGHLRSWLTTRKTAIVRVENSRAQVVGHERHCLVRIPISGQIPPRGTLVWTTWVTATAQVEEQIAGFWNQFWQRDPPLQQVEDDHWLAARQMVDAWAEQRTRLMST